jgi:hypothetical protein
MGTRCKECFDQKLNYIHANPVRAGLVREQEEWIYSSAADLTNPLPLLPVKTWLGYNCTKEIADHSCFVGHLAQLQSGMY